MIIVVCISTDIGRYDTTDTVCDGYVAQCYVADVRDGVAPLDGLAGQDIQSVARGRAVHCDLRHGDLRVRAEVRAAIRGGIAFNIASSICEIAVSATSVAVITCDGCTTCFVDPGLSRVKFGIVIRITADEGWCYSRLTIGNGNIAQRVVTEIAER